MPSIDARIMVVDDEYDIVHLVRRHLERDGYNVDAFTNPLYALEVFKNHPYRYSVILTDINMPEMRGSALAREMKKAKPDIKVMIMTAYDVEPEEFSYSLPSIKRDDILKKPFSLKQLTQSVQKQLQSA